MAKLLSNINSTNSSTIQRVIRHAAQVLFGLQP